MLRSAGDEQPSLRLARHHLEQERLVRRFRIQRPRKRRDRDALPAVGLAVWTARLGGETGDPVLYNPSRPERALLLEGFSFPLVTSQAGGWEAPPDAGPFFRAAAVLVCLAGPVVGWALFLLLAGRQGPSNSSFR